MKQVVACAASLGMRTADGWTIVGVKVIEVDNVSKIELYQIKKRPRSTLQRIETYNVLDIIALG